MVRTTRENEDRPGARRAYHIRHGQQWPARVFPLADGVALVAVVI